MPKKSDGVLYQLSQNSHIFKFEKLFTSIGRKPFFSSSKQKEALGLFLLFSSKKTVITSPED